MIHMTSSHISDSVISVLYYNLYYQVVGIWTMSVEWEYYFGTSRFEYVCTLVLHCFTSRDHFGINSMLCVRVYSLSSVCIFYNSLVWIVILRILCLLRVASVSLLCYKQRIQYAVLIVFADSCFTQTNRKLLNIGSCS